MAFLNCTPKIPSCLGRWQAGNENALHHISLLPESKTSFRSVVHDGLLSGDILGLEPLKASNRVVVHTVPLYSTLVRALLPQQIYICLFFFCSFHHAKDQAKRNPQSFFCQQEAVNVVVLETNQRFPQCQSIVRLVISQVGNPIHRPYIGRPVQSKCPQAFCSVCTCTLKVVPH